MARHEALREPIAEESIAGLLTLAQRRLTRDLAARLAEEGTGVDQWRVMRALADGEGATMGKLAEHLLIAQPTLTRLMDGLVDAGLVYRRQSTPDRRRVVVYLSRRGRQKLETLDALVAAHERSLMHGDRREELSVLLNELTQAH